MVIAKFLKGQNIQEDTIFIASENIFQSSPKNDVLPSITSTDASSTVGPMSDIVPPIDDENTLSDVVGYDSLGDKAKNRTHAKIMTNTDDNSPPGFDFQLKKQISKAGKDNKNTARTDQRAELSKILARHLKVAHEILYNADYHSLSTDDDFPRRLNRLFSQMKPLLSVISLVITHMLSSTILLIDITILLKANALKAMAEKKLFSSIVATML